MTIRSQIKSVITKVVTDKNLEFSIEVPNEKKHGDYAANVALVLAKKVKKNPVALADEIRLKIKNKDLFQKIEVIEPGFINFFLKPQFLQKQVKEIINKKEKFGEIDIGKNKKAQVEFISANPTGKLHLGNGRGAFLGDVLANVLTKSNYKVEREYYINDARNSKQIQELGKTALGKGETYLNDYIKAKVRKIKTKLDKVKNEGEAGHILAQGIVKGIKDFVEKKLKIKFDKWFFEEAELYKNKKADKVYDLLKKKKVVYKKEGAEWIRTSKHGDDKDWVIVRESGEPTYFLSDLAYHYNKFQERKFNNVINIWGADHHGYVKRMKAGVKILGINPERLDLIIMQLVRLVKAGKEVRMSKRKGEFATLEDLLKEVDLDVARFFFLMYSANRHMDFDLDLAKEKSQKNPVYYVQYAYARINSILKKAKVKKMDAKKLDLLVHPEELNLIKELVRLPEIIEDVSRDYQVQKIPHYAMDIATAFHRFYTDCKVLGDYKSLENARLSLVWATKIVLENVLDLMGITKPEKM